MEEFRKLGLSEDIVEVLKRKGYIKPTAIQARAIPLLLEGKQDIIAQSQTGTGKTASFALPIIEILPEHVKHVQAIILTPTRELALQVAKEIESLMGRKRLRVLAVYGGASVMEQRKKLQQGVDIVVGTPGRIMDQMERRSLDLSHVSFAVLDEADEMLNMGFLEDMEIILQKTNPRKRMLLFSATIPKPILTIARKFMHNPLFIEMEHKQLTIDLTEQIYYEIMPQDRLECLRRVIDVTPDFYGIVFCRTRADVDELSRKLLHYNYSAAALHGDISQGEREKILNQFRAKRITILVATDVAARGIDVNDLTHVINYSMPQSPESYIHRIGRTGRAGKKGIAVTLVVPAERGKLRFIERIVKNQLQKRELPNIEEVLEIKRVQIKALIEQQIKMGKGAKYTRLAGEILVGTTPVQAVAALLELAFPNKESYKEIHKVKEFERKAHGRDAGKGRRFRRRR